MLAFFGRTAFLCDGFECGIFLWKPLTDAQGGATHYVFDVRNLLQSETFPDGRSRFYGYDAGHRIVSRLDQASVRTNYVYDRANRMTTRAYPDNLNDTFSYDNASRLTLASSARYSNSVARLYDSASRLTVETLTVGATSYNLGYGYDADNRQTAVIYPSGDVVDRAFTDRNQLGSVSFNSVAVANLSYDDGRRLTTKNFGNGIVENRTYRNDNLISSIVTAGVDAFTYTWDANKRKLTQTEAGIPTNDQTFSYDSEDRLTNFARTNGDAQSWNLSLVGDWNQFNKNGTVENRTHNAVHETTSVDAMSLTYDVKGNLTQNKNGQVYSWDVENRLASASDATNTLGSYTYDALGRRTSKTVAANTTVFVSDGLQEVAEYVNGALSQSYVYGSYIDEPLSMIKANGDKLYYHTNDLYSVAALTDNNGNVVERYKYDPYGKVTVLAADGVTVLGASTVNNPFQYCGYHYDPETGNDYCNARYYSQELGRFISRDPIGYRGGIDLYEYCGDMPTNAVDPLGLKLTKEGGIVAFLQSFDLLAKACKDCCKEAGCPETRSTCTLIECRNEAHLISRALADAWGRQYGRGPRKDNDAEVGGWMCWHWAIIFKQALENREIKCFSYEIGVALVPVAANEVALMHFYLKVHACKGTDPECTVSFDDGFFDGENAAHRGFFPKKNSVYVEDTKPDKNKYLQLDPKKTAYAEVEVFGGIKDVQQK